MSVAMDISISALWRLLLLNSLVFGIEICAAAGFTFVPPLLLKSGMEDSQMSLVLGIGPFIALFLVPAIGATSDQCQSSLGRRRPFILILSAGICLSLVFIPYGELIGNSLGGKPYAMSIITLGVVLLDCCTQACFTPMEALLADIYGNTEMSESSFLVYTFMVSLGGCVGYLLTAIDWENSMLALWVGGQEQAVFLLLFLLFAGSLGVTVFTAKEKVSGERDSQVTFTPHRRCRICDFVPRACLQSVVAFTRLIPKGLTNSIEAPFVLRRLQVAHFFMWAALFCYTMFFSDFVGEEVYHGRPHALVGSDERKLYDEGVRMGSFGLLIQCVMAAVFSMFLETVVKQIGERRTLQLSMALFTVAMTLLVFVRTPVMVVMMSALTGFASAAANSLPYTLVGAYHEQQEIFFAFDSPLTESLRSSGVGVHMAALDSSYFLAQIMLSALMGYIVHITHSVTTYITCAALLGVAACFSLSGIIVTEEDLQTIRTSRALTVLESPRRPQGKVRRSNSGKSHMSISMEMF
ncbi:solute carrier family 45 member 3-like [Branchiostoma lanceolatum]|uniref:solute carrier family 45 member 3-like n=1 Tax=Branchiostoma lanceolatum TaxID=7740 RepID=UPI003452507D